MQIELQVLYQGYMPVTNVLIVEKRWQVGLRNKKTTFGEGCFVYVKNVTRLKKPCPCFPPGIASGASAPVTSGSEEVAAHFGV